MSPGSALDITTERYARNEISQEEYERIKKELSLIFCLTWFILHGSIGYRGAEDGS